MRHVSFYHKDTGLLQGAQLMASDESIVAINTPKDHIAIDGWHDHLSKRVNTATKTVEEYQPPAPSTEHEWDTEKKRWQLTATAATEKASKSNARIELESIDKESVALIRTLLVQFFSTQHDQNAEITALAALEAQAQKLQRLV